MENLKKLRIYEKKSTEDIASLLGISVQAYYRYENGQNEPNVENLCKLADLYNVSVDYLIGRAIKNDIGYLSDQERAMIETFKKLNEVNQIKVASYALGILSTQE
ncbi:MAG: helix-turn-helix transcriptional regulator [Clostridia bacterium]|nr:helix-turn-helix transcriptional regulator [Clostridia bacterium]